MSVGICDAPWRRRASLPASSVGSSILTGGASANGLGARGDGVGVSPQRRESRPSTRCASRPSEVPSSEPAPARVHASNHAEMSVRARLPVVLRALEQLANLARALLARKREHKDVAVRYEEIERTRKVPTGDQPIQAGYRSDEHHKRSDHGVKAG